MEEQLSKHKLFTYSTLPGGVAIPDHCIFIYAFVIFFSSSNVVKWAEETFSNSTFVLYEQVSRQYNKEKKN